MDSREVSIVVDEGGKSQLLTTVTTSQQSSVINSSFALVMADAACYVRQGADPTAVTDGTDIRLLANTHYRPNIKPGNKLAFAAGSAANIYITPGA